MLFTMSLWENDATLNKFINELLATNKCKGKHSTLVNKLQILIWK